MKYWRFSLAWNDKENPQFPSVLNDNSDCEYQYTLSVRWYQRHIDRILLHACKLTYCNGYVCVSTTTTPASHCTRKGLRTPILSTVNIGRRTEAYIQYLCIKCICCSHYHSSLFLLPTNQDILISLGFSCCKYFLNLSSWLCVSTTEQELRLNPGWTNSTIIWSVCKNSCFPEINPYVIYCDKVYYIHQ